MSNIAKGFQLGLGFIFAQVIFGVVVSACAFGFLYTIGYALINH